MGMWNRRQLSASTIQTPLYACMHWPIAAFLSEPQTQGEMLAEQVVGLSACLQSATHWSRHYSRTARKKKIFKGVMNKY